MAWENEILDILNQPHELALLSMFIVYVFLEEVYTCIHYLYEEEL